MTIKTFLLLFVFLPIGVMAQTPCSRSLSSIELKANRIHALIDNAGSLFNYYDQPGFLPQLNPNAPVNPSTILLGALWLAGADDAGNIKAAAGQYRNYYQFDFSPGPLGPDGVTDQYYCATWDRHFNVTADEVIDFQNNPPGNNAELMSQFPSIAGWPGRGNLNFNNIYGFPLPLNQPSLAPFFDNDLDGFYNPLNGDYPAVILEGTAAFVPSVIIWSVFNDENGGAMHQVTYAAPLQVEVHQTVWAFDCPENPLLSNTVFTAHRIFNRAKDTLTTFYVGMMTDLSIGCPSDDYAGCNPAQNTMYGYNKDAIDGWPGNNCEFYESFNGVLPVQSVTFLNRTLSSFTLPILDIIPASISSPNNPVEYYNALSGKQLDGAPYTYGGGGIGGTTPTQHLYPSDPADPQGWNMCKTQYPNRSIRMLGTHEVGTFAPGQAVELVTAWSVHPNPVLPCGIGTTLSDVAHIQTLFDKQFAGVCAPLKAPELPESSLKIYPNPADGQFVIEYGTLQPIALRAFDVAGRLVLEKTSGFGKKESNIATTRLSSGVYTLQFVTDSGTITKKLAIVR